MGNAYEIAKILMREMGVRRGIDYAVRKSLMGNSQINKDYAEAASIIKTTLTPSARIMGGGA